MKHKHIKYLKQISFQLDNFVETPSMFRFRCPFCRKTKRCGVVYQKSGLFFCHNCKKKSFGDLLELVNKTVFNEYIKEKYPNTKSNKKELLMEHELDLQKLEIDQHNISDFKKNLRKLNLSLKRQFEV